MTTTMDWKSEQETIMMEYFRELFPGFPPGRLVKHESPDFLLVQGQRKTIGIELTQIHSIDHQDNGYSVIHPRTGIEQVFHSITEKEQKIIHYLEPDMVKLWLIITAEEAPSHFSTRLKNYLVKSPIESNFDSIYLFILMSKTIIQLC